MKKVFIKYNPYKLETEFTVDGKKPAQNSKIGERILPGSRLQEWIEDLPRMLIDEYNDRDFNVVFHGTLLDYEDLTEVFTQAYNRGELTATLERIPAKETEDKEELIDQVFRKIQAGPFEELRGEEISNAFKLAKSSDFEVCVVATMSAGKSTLINAMLGNMLMPSKQEACTAIITHIKDVDGSATWRADVYDKDDKLIESHENLDYETMDRLNSNEKVSTIYAEGDIPFVTSEDMSLVLIDTPGPNNARDPMHKEVQSKFLSKSSKSLVLYIMEGTFGTDDDNALLRRVADSMKVGGKQSKDRFIFVVNKMDGRGKNDGDTAGTLDRVRGYLKNHGIANPNLFPAAALPALNIRLIQNGAEIDVDSMDWTEMVIRKLNRNESLHLENYTCLPNSVQRNIQQRLDQAQNTGDAQEAALIHSGVPSVEATIRQYVQKYAKTAKIKNIADTFTHKLDEVGYFEKTKQELATNQENRTRILAQIDIISQKLHDGETAKQFKDAVDGAVLQVYEDACNVIDEIVIKHQQQLRARSDSVCGQELKISQVDEEVRDLGNFTKQLESSFKADLDELISDTLISTSNALLNEYKKRLASLNDEMGSSTLEGFSLEPLRLIGGSLPNPGAFSSDDLLRVKRVEDGRHWESNTNKKWYKPWTWFQKSGEWVTDYKNVKYIRAEELAQKFFAPIEKDLLSNKQAAHNYALKQSNRIADAYKQEFKRLEDVLDAKLEELKTFEEDEKLALQHIQEIEKKLTWLKETQKEVASILDI